VGYDVPRRLEVGEVESFGLEGFGYEGVHHVLV